MDTEAVVVDALDRLGIPAQPTTGAPVGRVDLLLDPDGAEVPVTVEYRSLVTDQVAERLLAQDVSPGAVLLLVGDRVTEGARKILTDRRGGYLDLRGRLAIRADRLVIDVEVEPMHQRAERIQALSGKAGLEIATWLLMHPERGAAVRQLARDLGRSASTVSEVLSALRRDDLVDAKNAVVDARLFWQVADRWPTRRTYLSQLPVPDDATASALRLRLDAVHSEPGWALTDTVAAAAYGAPIAVRSGQLLDFAVPDQVLVRRAINLLGPAEAESGARCAVRVARVPAVCRYRVETEANPTEWPLTHPLFVALDLAGDAGRGREILDAWTPSEPWSRVW